MARKLIIFLLLFVAAERLCRLKTHGFTKAKIVASLPREPKQAPPHIEALLDQRFYFLGSGKQFYAFGGQDGKTVIKFVKQSRRRQHSPLDDIALFGPLEKWRLASIGERKKRRSELLDSCRIAEQKLFSECALLYANAGKPFSIKKRIEIFDNIGIAHFVDLEKTEFVLQKKATPLSLYLEENPESAKKALAQTAKLLKLHTEKKIALTDENLERNWGFLDNQAVEIDLGSFQEASKASLPDTKHFRKWLKNHHPKLVQYFDEALEDTV